MKTLSHFLKTVIAAFVGLMVYALCIGSTPEKGKNEALQFHYNGAIIDLPEEIDCATEGDTLIVYRTERTGKNSRMIYVGYAGKCECILDEDN